MLATFLVRLISYPSLAFLLVFAGCAKSNNPTQVSTHNGGSTLGGGSSFGGIGGEIGSGGATGISVEFPVVYSPNNRYLQDKTGTPFPILGRALWYLISLNELIAIES